MFARHCWPPERVCFFEEKGTWKMSCTFWKISFFKTFVWNERNAWRCRGRSLLLLISTWTWCPGFGAYEIWWQFSTVLQVYFLRISSRRPRGKKLKINVDDQFCCVVLLLNQFNDFIFSSSHKWCSSLLLDSRFNKKVEGNFCVRSGNWKRWVSPFGGEPFLCFIFPIR